MTKKKFDLILADDHQLILDGIVQIISQMEIVGNIHTANTGLDVLRLPQFATTDLVVADIEMPEMNGIQLLKKIKEVQPGMKVIILTMHNNSRLAREVIKLKADGYLLKTETADDMRTAIETVLSGKKYFSNSVTLELANSEIVQAPDRVALESLTQREREILPLIAQGLSNKQIAEKLFVSVKTIDSHRTNLMMKLDIHNIAGLTRFAIQNNLL